MNSFEDIKEQCIQNKENVDKWSKLLSTVLVSALVFIAYLNINTWGKFVLIPPIVFSIYYFVCKRTNYDRIFSKFPVILGTCLIIIMSVYLSHETSFFIDGFTVKCLMRWIIMAICAWLIGFSIHCISIYILDYMFFENPTLEYTTKIAYFEEKTQHRKHYRTVHYYYAYFYDYSLKLNKTNISSSEFNNWREGDVIRTVLRPCIDSIDVVSISYLKDFEGLTDWENDVQKHKIEVEQFGRSQEEKDAAKGNVKMLGFVWPFIFIAILIALPYCAFEPEFNELMVLCPSMFIGLAIAAIVLIGFISFKEYRRIVDKYSREDVKNWRDFFIPRGLLYFLVIFGIFGIVLTIYNTANEEYYEEICTVSKITETEKNAFRYVVSFERPDGTIYTHNLSWTTISKADEGRKFEVTFRRGKLGFDIFDNCRHLEETEKK